jgi:glycine/D-amino acid oxidase-like deaminating enzyme
MTPGGGVAQAGPSAQSGVFWQGGDPRWQPHDLVPLTTTARADVCIVGGGFTGLWTALSIKRLAPDADVVLLEREYCGAGASGRNGGWVNGWDKSLPRLVSRFGRDAALWLLDASRRSVADIRDTVRDGGIDCDFAMAGGLTVAASPAQAEALRATASATDELGRDDLLRILDRDEARALSGSPQVVAGELILHAGSVQPALLAQGLRRLAVEAGVRVYEATPMLALDRTLPAVVKTPSGAVVADKVVLAAGAWLAVFPELRRTLFIIPSHMVATASSREHLDRLGWVKGRPFSDNRTAVHYAQRTGDDRLAFGRGGGRLGFGGRVIPEHFHDPREVGEIVADMHALLPATRDLAVECAGVGPLSAASTTCRGSGPWARTRTSTTGSATRATGSRRPISSAARWPRSLSAGATTTRCRLWYPSHPRTCRRNPSAPSAPAPCAAPSSAARSWRTRDGGRTPCPGWYVAASTFRCRSSRSCGAQSARTERPRRRRGVRCAARPMPLCCSWTDPPASRARHGMTCARRQGGPR